MHRLSNEKGAVMLLVAMLASTLLLLAGLAIDSAVISNSKVQQRHAAEYMALGAIKAYNKSSTNKLQNAVDRAQQLASENHFLAKNFILNYSEEEIGETNNPNSTKGHGNITLGMWHFKAGEGSCNTATVPGTNPPIPLNYQEPCPCKLGNPSEWATPCFRKTDLSNASETPNATRVELQTATNSPIQTLFARVKGRDTISISSSATAVQLPRKAVFLVDLSRHSHNETHIPYPIAAGTNPTPAYGNFNHIRHSSEYTFITNNNCLTEWDNLCPFRNTCAFLGGNTGTAPNDLYSTIYNGQYRLSPFTFANILEDARVNFVNKTKHYKSDYQCFKSPSFTDKPPDPIAYPIDNIYPVSPTTPPRNYLADMYYNSANNYDGAEPLNTMLVGINEAINFLNSSNVPGDEVTVIGFDGSASIDVRTIGPNSINPPGASFEDLKNLSNLDFADPLHPKHNDYRISRFKNHMFYPRIDDAGMDKQKNIVEALKEAKKILLSAGSETSENFVTLISDGLSSCYETTDTSINAPKRCGTTGTDTLCSVCSNSFAGFMNSLGQIDKIITEEYIPNNIKFHFIQIGHRGAAHNVQRVKEKGGVKTCMTVKEMEAANPPLDTIDTTFVLTPGNVEEDEYKRITYGEIGFPPALELAKLAKKSKGKYVPIRPQCLAGSDVTTTLNTECETIANQAGSQDGQILTGGTYSDANGRVFCEPENRDRRAQMRDAIAEVFNEDPYVIVD